MTHSKSLSLVIPAARHENVPVLHVEEVKHDLAADLAEVALAVAVVARHTNLHTGGAESPEAALTHWSAEDRMLVPK